MTNPGTLFVGIMTNTGLWGAIISTIVITMLGFILFRTKVLNNESSGAIQKVIINVIIPFLSFYSFLKNADKADLKTFGIVFGMSAIYYVLLTSIAILWVKYLPKAVPKSVIARAQKDYDEWQTHVEFSQRQIFNREVYFESLQKKHLVTWLMCIYGSNILFATPIVLGVYPNGIELGSLSIWNVLYYIGGFGLSFSLLSGVKFTKQEFKFTMKKAVLNPAFITVIVAIVLWATQYIPGAGSTVSELKSEQTIQVKYGIDLQTKEPLLEAISVKYKGTFGPNFSVLYGRDLEHIVTNSHGVVTHSYIKEWFTYDKLVGAYAPYASGPTGWFDWSVTMPYFAKPITILAGLISPLIWIVIGTSLAKTNIKQMFSKGRNWLFLIYKAGLIPLFILCLVMPFVKAKLLSPSVGAVLVMTGAVPPGTTVVIYSQHFKVHEDYTSQVSSLATMLSFIFIPLWLVVGVVTLNVI
ncbi:AEC family transporter [Metamycoplasma neophronis]|uniref:Malate permease n=1 Tax=Metamycoplasma neophronis TaxID=872983 RepID=A0ABY2Z0Q4_9BACT|nr:AEC family transporter [Metamycoplasma neophronis]TPR54738.1 malate permease [Metamycoplasma neophronis]